MGCYSNNTFLAWIVVIIIILLILLFVWAINRVAERNPVEVNYTFTFINNSALPASLTVVDSKSSTKIYFKGNVAENERVEVINPVTAVDIDFLNMVDPQNSIIINSLSVADNVRFEIKDSNKGGGISVNSVVIDNISQIDNCIGTLPPGTLDIGSIKIVNSSGGDMYFTLGVIGQYTEENVNEYLQVLYNPSSITTGDSSLVTFTGDGQVPETSKIFNYYNTSSSSLEVKNIYITDNSSVPTGCYGPNQSFPLGFSINTILGIQYNGSVICPSGCNTPIDTPSDSNFSQIYITSYDANNPPTFTWNGTTFTGDPSTGAMVV